jgi:hypothetical protein
MPYLDEVINQVDDADGPGWLIRTLGRSCFVPELPITRSGAVLREAIVPKVGDRLRLYGQVGFTIQGLVLNEDVVYYRTLLQRQAHRRREIEDSAAKRSREFLLQKDDLDRDYDQLPELFQRRILSLRHINPRFREEHERYEMFVLNEAVKIAFHCRAMAGLDRVSGVPTTALEIWEKLVTHDGERSIEYSWKMLDENGLIDAAHTNETFPQAMHFARELLEHESDIPKVAT